MLVTERGTHSAWQRHGWWGRIGTARGKVVVRRCRGGGVASLAQGGTVARVVAAVVARRTLGVDGEVMPWW